MKNVRRLSTRARLVAGLVFALMLGGFAFLHWAAANDKIDTYGFIPACGFKERYGLPCPTCGVTTAVLAFAKGQVFEAFYIQPAAAFFCWIILCLPILFFLSAVLGTDFGLTDYFARCRIRYVIVVLIVVVLAGWSVTMARALVERS